MTNQNKITIEELDAWNPYCKEHLLDILNGEVTAEEDAENIRSFRNTQHYTGEENHFKINL